MQNISWETSKKWELYFILFLVLVSALVGMNASLDLDLARQYYSPETPNNLWPDKDLALWKFFYHAAPIITASILLPSIAVYILGFVKKSFFKYRRYAAYVFLAALLGPGILINTFFKPYWGRPRPRQVIELGGHEQMQAYWQKGVAGNGYSFPCGHSSVAFALVSLAFLLKRKRPKTALVVFGSSFGLGMVMGVGRMADGAHFFSDVLWSAVMSYIPAYFLYYKMKLYEDYSESFKPEYKKAIWQGSSLFIALLIGVSVATPYKSKIESISGSKTVELFIDHGNVKIQIDDTIENSFEIKGTARGFGFPKSKLRLKWDETGQRTLYLYKDGFFSDFEANYSIKVRSNLRGFKLNIKDKGRVLKSNTVPSNYIITSPSI